MPRPDPEDYWYMELRLALSSVQPVTPNVVKAAARGIVRGVEAYAVWKDGKQRCGVMEEPLENDIHKIEVAMHRVLADYADEEG